MPDPAPPDPAPRRRAVLRAALIFLACLALFALLLETDLVQRAVVEPLTRLQTHATGLVLRGVGQPVAIDGTSLVTDRFRLNILNGCNGVYAVSIYLAAVFAFPAPWRQRAAGAGLGAAFLLLVNLVRILSLYAVGRAWPDRLEWFHVYFWQTGIVLAALLTWFWWEERWVDHDTHN